MIQENPHDAVMEGVLRRGASLLSSRWAIGASLCGAGAREFNSIFPFDSTGYGNLTRTSWTSSGSVNGGSLLSQRFLRNFAFIWYRIASAQPSLAVVASFRRSPHWNFPLSYASLAFMVWHFTFVSSTLPMGTSPTASMWISYESSGRHLVDPIRWANYRVHRKSGTSFAIIKPVRKAMLD